MAYSLHDKVENCENGDGNKNHNDVSILSSEVQGCKPSYQAVSWKIFAMLLTCFLIVLTSVMGWMNVNTIPESQLIKCIDSYGGGPIGSRGDFPHKGSALCKMKLRESYFASDGAYFQELDSVKESAIDYFSNLMEMRNPTPEQVIAFDIDETALSNLQSFVENSQITKNVFSENLPALLSMLDVYNFLYENNYSLAFITGRAESSRNATVINLLDAGYGPQCHGLRSPQPCYVHLYMRTDDDISPASVYKPQKRKELSSLGFELVGNFGDQFSDLSGEFPVHASFKLPNPMYYIL